MPVPPKGQRNAPSMVGANGVFLVSKYLVKPQVMIYHISGMTLDASSNPLANCVVKLYTTQGDVEGPTTTSDGGGNYSFIVTAPVGTTFYVVAYLAGSPDVAGTTINTLVGS